MKKSLLVCTTLTFFSATDILVQAQPSPGALPPQGVGTQGGPEGNNPQHQEFRQKMLERFDTNHDGKLDENERAQMRQFMEQRRMPRGQSGGFGSNFNPQQGQGLTPSGQGLTPPGGGFNPQQMSEHKQKMLERFDANHDGKLDENERAQMRQFMEQHRMPRQQGRGLGGPGSMPTLGPSNGAPGMPPPGVTLPPPGLPPINK